MKAPNPEFLDRLRSLGPVRLDEALSRHVTFGVGGPADVFFAATTEDQLRGAYALAKQHGVPVFIFGSGSNILVGDKGIRGLVIENRTESVEGPVQNGAGLKIRVASGVSFAALARRLSASGYGGLEWAAGIPGSLGGAVVTNAGAYGSALSDVLKSARLADEKGQVMEVAPGDLQLTYRESAFTSGAVRDRIVLSVDLRVQRGDAATLKERVRNWMNSARRPSRRAATAAQSSRTLPANTAPGTDQVGLRGHRIGNACFSEQHTNFIQNLGGATAADITALIRLAQDRVRERFNIQLETEVFLVGEFA
jgi:UDP-N-acetylmuramate dehydrogenase